MMTRMLKQPQIQQTATKHILIILKSHHPPPLDLLCITNSLEASPFLSPHNLIIILSPHNLLSKFGNSAGLSSPSLQATGGQPKKKVMMLMKMVMMMIMTKLSAISNVSWAPLAFDFLAVVAQLSGALLWPLLQVILMVIMTVMICCSV